MEPLKKTIQSNPYDAPLFFCLPYEKEMQISTAKVIISAGIYFYGILAHPLGLTKF